MAKRYRFQCTKCGVQPGTTKEEARNNLYVKQSVFRRYGMGGQLLRIRAVAWLCVNCLRADPDYNMAERGLSERMTE